MSDPTEHDKDEADELAIVIEALEQGANYLDPDPHIKTYHTAESLRAEFIKCINLLVARRLSAPQGEADELIQEIGNVREMIATALLQTEVDLIRGSLQEIANKISALRPSMKPATGARKLADEIYAWYENSLGRHPDGNDDPSIGAGAMIERFAQARAEARLTVDEANELTKTLKARADQAEADAKALRKALEDFAEHGTRHDPNPTMEFTGDELKMSTWCVEYMKSMDKYVCEKARAALGSTSPKEEL